MKREKELQSKISNLSLEYFNTSQTNKRILISPNFYKFPNKKRFIPKPLKILLHFIFGLTVIQHNSEHNNMAVIFLYPEGGESYEIPRQDT